MPARFGGVAAHALGDQAQPHRPARLGRQLQPPPGGQGKCGCGFQHDHGDGPVPQGLFRHG